MPNEEKSPAVLSMEQEQKKQRSDANKGDLDTALEDTFPASDPVSMTSTSILSRRADTAEADSVHRRTATSDGLLGEACALVKKNPLTALGIVAAIAFVYGATR